MRLQRRLEHVNAGDRLQVQVDEHDVELAAADDVERFIASSDESDVVPVHFEDAGAALPQRPVVVHDEDANVCLDRGRNGQRIATDA